MNTIPYWVGQAEIAAEYIAFWQSIVSFDEAKGLTHRPNANDELGVAKAAHAKAMNEIMRLNASAFFPFDNQKDMEESQ